MISAQTLRVCRDGKPLHTFPDHALRRRCHAWQRLDRLQRDMAEEHVGAFGLKLDSTMRQGFTAAADMLYIADAPSLDHGYAVDHMNRPVAEHIKVERVPIA